MKKLLKKRLKGMTLVEVIVALCVFTIMTSAMASCASTASRISKDCANQRTKMNIQADVADNRGVNDTTVISGNTVTVGFDNGGHTVVAIRSGRQTICNDTVVSDNGINYSYFELE